MQDCLEKCQSSADIKNLARYTTGTRQCADHYQCDPISTTVDLSKVKPGVKYVIKCFIHLGLYAAWKLEIGRGNGKYIVYKKDLIAMQNELECHYKEVTLGDQGKFYLFRGEEGAIKFFKEHLLKDY